jgi:hypothetical protein
MVCLILRNSINKCAPRFVAVESEITIDYKMIIMTLRITDGRRLTSIIADYRKGETGGEGDDGWNVPMTNNDI